MQHFAFVVLFFLGALPALAQWPARDLKVVLRQVEESSGAVVLSTQKHALFESQQIRVRNGHLASVSVGQSIPVQWVQPVLAIAAASEESARGAPTQNPTLHHAGLLHPLTWLHAGQRLTVLPRWPGRNQDVTIELEVLSPQGDAHVAPDLPTQLQSHVRTTLITPLGQWVTLAVTGKNAPGGGVNGSETPDHSRRLLQLRVTAL